MSYTQTKKETSKLRSEKRKKESELQDLEQSIEDLQEQFQESYNELTLARAELEINSTKDNKQAVQDAEKRNRELKQKITAAKEDRDTKKEVVRILSEKLQKKEAEFTKEAASYHREKINPVLNEIASLMEGLEEKLNELAEYRQEIQADGLVNPNRFFKGIQPGSTPVITKRKLSGMDARNYITTHNLKGE